MSFVERSPAELIAAGTAAFHDGRPAEAAELLARAAALRPGDARLAHLLGCARHRADGPEAALAAFRAAEAVAGRMRDDAAAPDLALDLADGATAPATFTALAAIPHYARRDAGREQMARKARRLERTIDRLVELFSPRSWTLDAAGLGQPAAAASSAALDVVVMTADDQHALDQLEIDASLFQHQPTGAEPARLGFEAHRLIWETAGRYDFVLYLEDDVLLCDPELFHKLRWFNTAFGSEVCLHPRAFEATLRDGGGRVYVEAEADAATQAAARAFDKAGPELLCGDYAGRRVRFVRPNNLYAGCFALSGEQALMWSESPYFLDGDASYGSPRRSAAGLGLAKCFDLRQPHADDCGFLHVRRQGEFDLRQAQASAVGARAGRAVEALFDRAS